MDETLVTKPVRVSKTRLWVGRILSALPVLLLLMSGIMKLVKPAPVVEGFTHLGYPEGLALGIGMLELLCTLLYVIPRTSVLGAILLTGYLGGATATHVRVGEGFFAPVLLGAVLWLGLLLREPRLGGVLPLRRDPAEALAPRRGVLRLLRTIGLGFVALVAVLAVVVALQPPTFRVERTTKITAPPATVFAQVNDFHNWEAWSPWAKLDPAAKNTFDGPASGTGAGFTWSGNDQVGEGRMTITESRPGELVRIKLDFKKPFESTCTSEFTFKPEGDQTVVTWSMFGENNAVGKALHLVIDMDKCVGGSFEQGLAQIKTISEGAAKK